MSTIERSNVKESPAHIANEILQNSPYPAIRSLTCSFADGVLVIGGRVPTFHLKQVAQSAVKEIAGVQRVDNQVEVS